MVSILEKNSGQKSRATVPLNPSNIRPMCVQYVQGLHACFFMGVSPILQWLTQGFL
jgi:hypothetical protein